MDCVIKEYTDFIENGSFNYANKIFSELDNLQENIKIEIAKHLIYNDQQDGYIYCIHNDMYKYYGENVYKLGKTENMQNRLNGYKTAYISQIDVVYLSDRIDNYNVAERLLFCYLENSRMTDNREFFNCDKDTIKNIIDKIVHDVNNKCIDTEYLYNCLSKAQQLTIDNFIGKIPADLNICNSNKDEYIKRLTTIKHISNEEANLLNNKKILSRQEKDLLKRYNIEQKFKLDPDEFCQEFLENWYQKEYILDNALYSLGIKPILCDYANRSEKTKKQLNYLNQILAIYGFNNILDMNKEVMLDDAMRKRMENSCLTSSGYNELKKTFNKQMKNGTDSKTFKINNFTLIANSILNEFGISIDISRKQKRVDRQKISIYYYGISELNKNLKTLIKRNGAIFYK